MSAEALNPERILMRRVTTLEARLKELEAWKQHAQHSLGSALIAMGRSGANCDVDHPQRAAWVECRETIRLTPDESVS